MKGITGKKITPQTRFYGKVKHLIGKVLIRGEFISDVVLTEEEAQELIKKLKPLCK